jgi:hypothetical protein
MKPIERNTLYNCCVAFPAIHARMCERGVRDGQGIFSKGLLRHSRANGVHLRSAANRPEWFRSA